MRLRLFKVLLLSAALATPLGAQASAYEFEVAAGVAVANGLGGRTSGTGALLRASLQRRDVVSRVRVRLDAEALWLPGNDVSGVGVTTQGGLTAVSAVYNALVASPHRGIAPYALGGAALQFISSGEADSYPVGLLGLRLGAGVRTNAARFGLSLEVAAQRAVFSTFGSIKDTKVGAYWPVTLGVRF